MANTQTQMSLQLQFNPIIQIANSLACIVHNNHLHLFSSLQLET